MRLQSSIVASWLFRVMLSIATVAATLGSRPTGCPRSTSRIRFFWMIASVGTVGSTLKLKMLMSVA